MNWKKYICKPINLLSLCLSLWAFVFSDSAYATHAQSTDITFRWITGNTYELRVAFYRDCAGIAAPGDVDVNCFSASCGQNFDVTLDPVPGTGQEVSPICSDFTTQCAGGPYPGVQEWVYTKQVTLSQCDDWVFSYDICCRNAAINTIDDPLDQDIYVEAHMDNLNYSQNSSPLFSNRPIPFVCVGQDYCFNHGATDADGDSLSYTLVTPSVDPGVTVNYLAGYTPTQPLISTPLISFDGLTGDICMNPDQIEVTVMAVLVEEWRNGVKIGSVIRDMQIRTLTCTNTLPEIDGIDGTGIYAMNACEGQAISFFTNSSDADATQDVTITWNSGIAGANFTSSGGSRPVGTFTWTPPAGSASATPYYFTVTVTDDNCPVNGSQTFSFAITISTQDVDAGTAVDVCASNPNQVLSGSVAAPATGGIWSSLGGGTFTPSNTDMNPTFSPSASEIAQGWARVLLTATGGTCAKTDSIDIFYIVDLNGTVTPDTQAVSCNGDTDGSASVTVVGGNGPYTYSWNTTPVQNTDNISNLAPGNYSVLITDGVGCQKTVDLEVLEPAVLTATATNSDVSCLGGSDGGATATPSGGTQPYNYSWSTGGTGASISGQAIGTYTVNITDSEGCPTSTTATIAQPATAVSVTASVGTDPTCNGYSNGTASASGSGGTGTISYSWSSGQSNANASGLSAGTYTITATDANGCPATTTVTLSEPTALAASTLETYVSCNGGSDGTSTVTVTGGTSPYDYSWNTSPVQTTAAATGLSQGNYVATITDANGCVIGAGISILEPTALAASLVSYTDLDCALDADGTAAVSGSGGTAPYTYAWNSTTQTTANITGLSGGRHLATITDSKGCEDTVSVFITEPPEMVPAVELVHVTCNGEDDGSITITPAGGTAPYTYAYSSCACTDSSITQLTAGTYTVTITDDNGCQEALDVAITEPDVLTASSSVTDLLCYNDSSGTATITPNGGTGPYTYLWNNGQKVATGTSLSATTYYVTVMDDNGCIVNTTVDVAEPTMLVASTTVVNATCKGFDDGSATVDGQGGTPPYKYSWNHTNELTQNISKMPAGTYTAIIEDANQCQDTEDALILEPDSVITNAIADMTICAGGGATLTAQATGGSGSYTYTWSTLTDTDSSVFVNPLNEVTYTVTATDDNGCAGTSEAITVSVTNIEPSNVALMQPGLVCNGDTITLGATVTGNVGTLIYSWNNGLDSSLGPFDVIAQQSTQYIFKAEDACGNEVIDTIDITVNQYPDVNVSPKSTTGCDLASITFDDTVTTYANCTFRWDFGDSGTISTMANPTHAYLETGIYDVTVYVTTPEGCTKVGTTKATVAVNASPEADFIPSPKVVSIFEPSIHFVDNSFNTTIWEWDFGDGDTSMEVSPLHTYDTAGIYAVTLITKNQAGCVDTLIDFIEIRPEFTFYIPNSFTPNGDGQNDFFTGKGENIIGFNMTIFNRWGELIFETDDMENGWDGSVAITGDEEFNVQQEVYVYKVQVTDFQNNVHDYIGHVTLLR